MGLWKNPRSGICLSSHTRQLILTASLAALATTSRAGTINAWSGLDYAVTNPAGLWPNSTSAQATFESNAMAFGPLNTITFENLPTGSYSTGFLQSTIPAAPGVVITEGSSAYLGVHSGDYPGQPFSSGFNTTPGGSNFLTFPEGFATFTFAAPTNSFGFFLTGVQLTTLTTAIDLQFNDGTAQTLSIPIDAARGVVYYGFIDTSPFSSITVQTVNNQGFVFFDTDDFTYNNNFSTNTGTTPEPSSLLLLSTGALVLAGAIRRNMKV